MAKAKQMSDYDRGVIVGIALACSIAQSTHDCPTILGEVLGAAALDRRKMKAAGVDDYDLKILRPVFRELRH